jgi:hypothetical protein
MIVIFGKKKIINLCLNHFSWEKLELHKTLKKEEEFFFLSMSAFNAENFH